MSLTQDKTATAAAYEPEIGGGTLTALFLGPWLLLVAATAAAGSVQNQSRPGDIYPWGRNPPCGSILEQGTINGARLGCTDDWHERQILVGIIALIGLALVVTAVVGLVRDRPLPGRQAGPRVPIWRAIPVALVGLTAPFVGVPLVVVTLLITHNVRFGSPLLWDWYPLGLAAEVVLVSAVASSSFALVLTESAASAARFTRHHAFAVGALALPVMAAIQVDWVSRDGRLKRLGDYPAWTRPPSQILWSGVAVAVLLVIGLLLQRRGWKAPPSHIGILLLLFGAACLSVLAVPALAPWWRSIEPTEGVYRAFLWAPFVVSLLVIAGYAWSGRNSKAEASRLTR